MNNTRNYLFRLGKRKQHGTPLPVLQVCRGRGVEEIKEWLKDYEISEEKETTEYSLKRLKILWNFLKREGDQRGVSLNKKFY